MNVLAILSVICFASVTSVRAALSEAELRRTARDSVQRLAAINMYLQQIRNSVEQVLPRFDGIKNRLDYGIPYDSKMVELDQLLKANKNKANIQSCITLKKQNASQLKNELKGLLDTRMQEQVANSRLAANFFLQQVNDLTNSLQGSQLEYAIQFCLNNEQECKITNEYTARIFRLTDVIASLSNTVNNAVERNLQSHIQPIVAEKVLSDVYTPVVNCVNSL